MFILDTDHVSLWLRNNPLVRAKVDASAQDVSLTVITVQELFNGWVSRLNTTADSGLMLERYANFCQTIEFVKQFPQNAIVVTRNQRDFSQIPGLQIVDWSSP
jgi:tRNA(fMet)-specific endonuclease VapC